MGGGTMLSEKSEVFGSSKGVRLVPFRDDGRRANFVDPTRGVMHAAGVDRLTGLLDRYGLLDRLETRDSQSGSTMLVVKVDILKFHEVNSGFGYDVGDALLCSAAARLATLPA